MNLKTIIKNQIRINIWAIKEEVPQEVNTDSDELKAAKAKFLYGK